LKLSDYAKLKGVTYRTAWNWAKSGIIQTEQLPTRTIIVKEEQEVKSDTNQKVVLYARVSSSENRKNLDTQLERLKSYASAKGYTISKEVKEVGSGLNDKRQKLEKVLLSDDWSIIVVEHKDRFSRFGFNYISLLLKKDNKKIEVINENESEKEDLMSDFVAIITSFTARLYGQRRSRRKTETLIEELKK
jgi:putative resolvase